MRHVTDLHPATVSRYCAPDLHREGHYQMTAIVCLYVCLFVCLSVYHVPRSNWTTESLRKPKIGMMEARHTSSVND